MSLSNINVRVDSGLKDQAQQTFSALGMDMTTAINIFLRQTIRVKGIPFPIIVDSIEPVAKKPKLGGWEGKIRMAPDFDAPLDDFKEYM